MVNFVLLLILVYSIDICWHALQWLLNGRYQKNLSTLAVREVRHCRSLTELAFCNVWEVCFILSLFRSITFLSQHQLHFKKEKKIKWKKGKSKKQRHNQRYLQVLCLGSAKFSKGWRRFGKCYCKFSSDFCVAMSLHPFTVRCVTSTLLSFFFFCYLNLRSLIEELLYQQRVISPFCKYVQKKAIFCITYQFVSSWSLRPGHPVAYVLTNEIFVD